MPQQTPLDRLPDPLLVRLYKEARLADIIDVTVALPPKRDVLVKYRDGTEQKFIHLVDVGWIPET